MRSFSKINEGELLSISYLPWEDLTQPTMLRRNKLFINRHFVCNCSRCTGPDTTRVLPCPTLDCTGSICILQRNMNDPPRWNCDSGNVACEFKVSDLGSKITPVLGDHITEFFDYEDWLLLNQSTRCIGRVLHDNPDPASIANWLEMLGEFCGKKHWLYADNLDRSVSMLFEYYVQKCDGRAISLAFTYQLAYLEWTRGVFAGMPDNTPYSKKAIITVHEFYKFENHDPSFSSPIWPFLSQAIQLVHSIEPSVRCEWGNDLEDKCKLRRIMLNYCAHCGIRGILKCTACKRVAYCSTAHQKADWKKHGPVCVCLPANA